MPTLPGQARYLKTATSLTKEGSPHDSQAGDVNFVQRLTSAVSLASLGTPGSPSAPSSPQSGGHTQSAQSMITGLLSSTTANLGGGSARTATVVGSSFGQHARDERKRRRGDVTHKTTVGDLMDGALASAVEAAEQPWFLTPCLEQPVCQRVCYPAEYATRHARANKREENTPGAGGEGDEAQDTHVNYGFPDFTVAGFTLMDNAEARWVDKLVPSRLGLVFATHRKTSVQRLCYIIEKRKLPSSTKQQDITVVMRSLKRCDHVNILQVNEVFEDEGSIYMMYESFPCCTLYSQLEQHTWTQEQIVNVARECCAATAYCASQGLRHMGWTLCHILLPASAANGGDPAFAKVFGFGLMGTLQMDTYDHILWGPEALEKYRQQGGAPGNFLHRLEGPQLASCDCWSLGAIIYSLIARRPPASLEDDILEKRWSFPLAIDDMDPEAKTLVEGFLHPNPDRRLRPDSALHHEWVRRRWRPSPGADEVFLRMCDFVAQPLAKRLFARFLTFYLDAEHFLSIAKKFSKLDVVGNGVIMQRELELAAKSAEVPESTAQGVHAWFARDGNEHISLLAFAECYAEEVIDGKALRHAFESLDDDGSQQITADELFHALGAYDGSLSMQDVIKHIDSAELEADGEGAAAQDHTIDYSEFVRLFPGRVRRMKKLEDRLSSSRSLSDDLSQRFRSHQSEFEGWVGGLDDLIGTIRDLSARAIQRGDQASDAIFELRKHFAHAEHGLKCPPGPENAVTKAQRRGLSLRSQKRVAARSNGNQYGFDTFVQDIALRDQWSNMLTGEMKLIKSATASGKSKVNGQSEQLKAHDAAEGLIRKVTGAIDSTKLQLEEYLSFVEAFEMSEPSLHEVGFSGRALPPRCGEADEEDLLMQAGDNDGAAGRSNIARFLKDVTARIAQLTGR